WPRNRFCLHKNKNPQDICILTIISSGFLIQSNCPLTDYGVNTRLYIRRAMAMADRITSVQYAPFLHKTRYEECFPENTAREADYRLPKILHFVWIASHISQEYIDLVKCFSMTTPTFVINLWLDDHSDIAKITEENTNITLR